MDKQDQLFSDMLDVVVKVYEILRVDLKKYAKVCVYDWDREIIESLIVRLKANDNMPCKYIHDGTNGFIKRTDIKVMPQC